MSGLFKHKFLILFIIAGIAYWVKNPADRFGHVQKGFVIYNRVPVVRLDCYINADGKLFMESDLSLNSSRNYWIENHLGAAHDGSKKEPLLLVGTGFGKKKEIVFTDKQQKELRSRKLKIKYLRSPAAIIRFNEMREKELPVSLLLKVK